MTNDLDAIERKLRHRYQTLLAKPGSPAHDAHVMATALLELLPVLKHGHGRMKGHCDLGGVDETEHKPDCLVTRVLKILGSI